MKIIKGISGALSLLCACILVCGLFLKPFVSFANWRDLIIVSQSDASKIISDSNATIVSNGSNAFTDYSDPYSIMTLDLEYDDYSITPRSSVGTVNNTVSGAYVQIYYTNGTYQNSAWVKPEYIDNRWVFNWSIPDGFDGYYINYVQYYLVRDDVNYNVLPKKSGNYYFSMDFSSDFSMSDFTRLPRIQSFTGVENAATIYDFLDLSYTFDSGDFYIYPIALNLKSRYKVVKVWTNIKASDKLRHYGGSYSIRFEETDEIGEDLVLSPSLSDSSSEIDISSSFSDLSSSVGEMSDEISGVTEAIQSLQAAMEPHYNNVLTQLHHVTEQLHALWDQQYNMHHLPLMDKLAAIIDAIANIDVVVNQSMEGVKTSIDTMSQAVQNKVQSVADHITGGYDNSAMESEKSELSGSVEELEQAEKEVMDNVTGYLEDFEYPTFDSISGGVLASIAFIGTFLQSLFLAIGDFGLIITFSLTMIFVLIIVGYHRIRT